MARFNFSAAPLLCFEAGPLASLYSRPMADPANTLTDGAPAQGGPDREDTPLSVEDAAKVVNLANAFAGDIVKKWILALMGKKKVKDVFPDGWLEQVAVTRMVSAGPTPKTYELHLEVVPADYRLVPPADMSGQQLGQQVTYLLTMVRTYLQYATQRYEALKDHPWLYTSLVPSPHGTVYSLGLPDGQHIGVVVTERGAASPLKMGSKMA